MGTILAIVGLLVVTGALAFYGVSRYIWTVVVAAYLCLLSYSSVTLWLQILCWIIFLGVVLLVYVRPFRLRWCVVPLLQYFKKALPPISETERVALEAGQVWVEGSLFQGSPAWDTILQLRQPQLSESEQYFLDNEVEQLCHMIDDWLIVNEIGDLPATVWVYIKNNGFLGLIVPKEYGGRAFSALAHSTIVAKIASRSISAAVSVMVPNSLGPAELIINYGTPQQKDYYLPRLANGTDIPCFALTGVEAGSDAGAISDRGVVVAQQVDGSTQLFIKLNWEKRYITLAPIATLLGLAFKLSDPDNLLQRHQVDLGITLALIPTEHPGVEIGKRHAPMDLAFMNGTTRGKEVLIPISWVIGGQEQAGHGWQMLMEELSVGRAISLPALATATAKLSYRMTGAYAKLRKQFKQPLVNFDGVATVLARIAGHTYIIEATRVMTADAVGQQIKPSLVSAITKYHLTEMARVVINDAMDIHAGRGIQFGPRNYLGLHYIAMPISITVEGANILTRNLMIFGQGAMRCHPYVRKEIEAANHPDSQQGLFDFDTLILSHAGYAFKNLVRCMVYGVTAGKLIRSPREGAVAPYYRQLTRMSCALAVVADVAMTVLGGALKRQECLSARLGDVLSQLYMGVAVLKYFEDHQRNAADLPHLEWALQTCLYQIQEAFAGFLANFPVPMVARCLTLIIFPWGKHYQRPTDILSQQVAQAMTTPSTLRDRLTRDCYWGKHSDDPTGRMEAAMAAMIVAQAADSKLQHAINSGLIARHPQYQQQLKLAQHAGILTAAEVTDLVNYENLRQDAMAVDEFSGGQGSVYNS